MTGSPFCQAPKRTPSTPGPCSRQNPMHHTRPSRKTPRAPCEALEARARGRAQAAGDGEGLVGPKTGAEAYGTHEDGSVRAVLHAIVRDVFRSHGAGASEGSDRAKGSRSVVFEGTTKVYSSAHIVCYTAT